MSQLGRRVGLLGVACALVVLAACSIGPVGTSVNNQGAISFSTPDTAQYTATPTFPSFTVAIQVSDLSPNPGEIITIYVWCRVQDPTMLTPAMPPNPPLGVTVFISGPVSATLQGTTGADGIAAITYTANSPIGQPVDIQASVNYKGQTYDARGFFTVGVTMNPTPTGSPGTTPTAGG